LSSHTRRHVHRCLIGITFGCHLICQQSILIVDSFHCSDLNRALQLPSWTLPHSGLRRVIHPLSSPTCGTRNNEATNSNKEVPLKKLKERSIPNRVVREARKVTNRKKAGTWILRGHSRDSIPRPCSLVSTTAIKKRSTSSTVEKGHC
jgi:hypothetical protein